MQDKYPGKPLFNFYGTGAKAYYSNSGNKVGKNRKVLKDM